MKIKTGYFAQVKKYEALGYEVVGVTRFPPKWYTGLNLYEFAPSVGLLNSYKKGIISEQDFEDVYLKELKSNVDDALSVLTSLGVDKLVLCCFEKSEDFCHRHILASYLNETYNLDINELVVSNKKGGK